MLFIDSLIMENGRDLMDMICNAYESPDSDDEHDHYNFSEPPFKLVI
jgi:hypothetical protein